MRVGLIIYGSLETISGGYVYDRQLVQTLRAYGDEVVVISLPWRSYGQHVLDNWRGWWREWESAEFDLLLQDELNHPSLAWLNPRLRQRLGCPFIAIVHHLRASERHPPWLRQLYRRIETRYLRSVDGFIFNSHTTRRSVAALLETDRPAVVAPPGGDRFPANTNASSRPPIPPLRLLFVGNLIRRKGLYTLLQAIAQLPPGLVELSIVGNPDLEPGYSRAWRQFAAKRGLAVRWLGTLDNAALADAFTAHHILTVPSDYEGFGIVYLEGMGFGLPAIATTAGAAAELITPGENGYLIAPGDTPALAGHLLTLAHDPLLPARLGRNALARFAAHPTWFASMSAARQFLLTQLNPPPTRPAN